MKHRLIYFGILFICITVIGYGQVSRLRASDSPTLAVTIVTVASSTPLPTDVSTVTPFPTATILPTIPPTTAPTTTPTLTPTQTPTIIPSLTPLPTMTPPYNPYKGLRIDDLAAREYGSGQVEIVETLERNKNFNRYLISYPSDGLTIYGFLNVPQQGEAFPVAIVLHGFVNADDYEVQDYTTEYADWLAEEGFMVFHPTYRNYPPSDVGNNPFRIGYAIDVLNLIGIIREQVNEANGLLRRGISDGVYLMGHSMGGGIAQRVLVVRPQWLRAVALYASMSGDEERNYAKLSDWTDGHAGIFERATPDEELAKISPANYLDRAVNVPVHIHHGEWDKTVPVWWSQELCADLHDLDYDVHCYNYPKQPHNLYGEAEDTFVERLILFFQEY